MEPLPLSQHAQLIQYKAVIQNLAFLAALYFLVSSFLLESQRLTSSLAFLCVCNDQRGHRDWSRRLEIGERSRTGEFTRQGSGQATKVVRFHGLAGGGTASSRSHFQVVVKKKQRNILREVRVNKLSKWINTQESNFTTLAILKLKCSSWLLPLTPLYPCHSQLALWFHTTRHPRPLHLVTAQSGFHPSPRNDLTDHWWWWMKKSLLRSVSALGKYGLLLLHHLLLFLPARHHPVSLYVPRMWRFVWHVSHTLCYQHLCDEHKHSLRGLAGRVGWVGVSQMVQCQGPQVWFWGWRVRLRPLVSQVLSPRSAEVPSSLTQGERPDWTQHGASDPCHNNYHNNYHNSRLFFPFVLLFFLP